MRLIIAAALAATMLASCTDSQQPAPPEETASYSAATYAAAIADSRRPQADTDRDAARMPGELLAFAQIDSGEAVGDYIMGGGYLTRLLAGAVGEQGKVYAFQPTEFIAFRADYASEQDTAVAPYPGLVVPLRAAIAAPGFPEPLDTIITAQNLHDLFIGPMPAGTSDAAIKALYDALKPGGVLVVVDHRAVAGSGAAAADAVHRMDEALARAALTSAGFVLEATSELYAQPDDPRTANVFDPAIRGATDQFLWRLRKPETANGAE